MMALNVELRKTTTLNAKTDNTALNAKQKRDMIAPNVELRTNDDFKRQNEDATLNTKMRIRL